MTHYLETLNLEVDQLCERLAHRISEGDLARIREAYGFAADAHAPQRRKTGEPYIMHPVAVAHIVAEEFQMDANSIIAAFLHDVVEDTPFTNDDIRARFGEDVAFLVKVVTKPKGKAGTPADCHKQENNFRQLLDSIRFDIRAVLIKLADRLHNMRTLGSMLPVKQMKIGAETDFFYAPFANRLGLNNLRRELENLSFKFRSTERYRLLEKKLLADQAANAERLERLTTRIKSILADHGLEVRTEVRYRLPYSIAQRMREQGCDFEHVEHRYVVRVIYDRSRLSPSDKNRNDKAICLRCYGALTNHFKEKAGSIINYVDNPKENGYQSFHVQILGEQGIWEEIHISSEEMVRRTKLGLMLDSMEAHTEGASHGHGNKRLARDDRRWMAKFCDTLREIAESKGNLQYMEGVSASLYSEDITIYDEAGKTYALPQHATALDYAFERGLGQQAQYARIDGKLASLRTELTHGTCVEIGTHPEAVPQPEWVDAVKSYKAKDYLKAYFRRTQGEAPNRCPICAALPGQEVIGIRDGEGEVVVHRRDCPRAISLSAQRGDDIVEVDFPASEGRTYPVRTHIRAIDRYHLVSDIVDCITNGLGLSMTYLNVEMQDNIVECRVHYAVHSVNELRTAVRYLATIDGVDEVFKV